jgi:hypothetical protein
LPIARFEACFLESNEFEKATKTKLPIASRPLPVSKRDS